MKIRLDKFTKELFTKAYPKYEGRRFFLEVSDKPINCKSWWDGGSRDYFVFVNLATREVCSVPAQSAYDRQINGLDNVVLPVGFACIRHSFFCGRDCGLTIIIRPENAAKFLPPTLGTSDKPEHQGTVLP